MSNKAIDYGYIGVPQLDNILTYLNKGKRDTAKTRYIFKFNLPSAQKFGVSYGAEHNDAWNYLTNHNYYKKVIKDYGIGNIHQLLNRADDYIDKNDL